MVILLWLLMGFIFLFPSLVVLENVFGVNIDSPKVRYMWYTIVILGGGLNFPFLVVTMIYGLLLDK